MKAALPTLSTGNNSSCINGSIYYFTCLIYISYWVKERPNRSKIISNYVSVYITVDDSMIKLAAALGSTASVAHLLDTGLDSQVNQ